MVAATSYNPVSTAVNRLILNFEMVSVENKTIFHMSANSEIDKIRAHPAEYLKIYYDNSAEIWAK